MTMPVITFSFATHDTVRDMVVEALKHAVHPTTGDRPTSVKLKVGLLTNDLVVLEFPEPRPDILALIRAWHAEPTKENARKLWEGIRDRRKDDPRMGDMAVDPFSGLAYVAEKDGRITVI